MLAKAQGQMAARIDQRAGRRRNAARLYHDKRFRSRSSGRERWNENYDRRDKSRTKELKTRSLETATRSRAGEPTFDPYE
jgi:hypothetical protein